MHAGDIVDGRFELVAIAGEGGMGTVWKAIDHPTGARAAVKTMLLAAGDAERFVQEAVVLRDLEHPAIVHYLSHGLTIDEERYLAMEWLEGETLAARLERGAVGVGDALTIVRRAAEALAFAHARGVVHRDVKPSNLFLVGKDPERLKVLDFGVARLVERARALTRPGTALGTLGYMSPEQIRGEPNVDARADVFSLGCVLFECVAGRPVFEGAHAIALVAKILAESPPALGEIGCTVDEALEALVSRMMAKDRAARPRDGAAVVDALDALGDAARASSSGAPKAAVASEERRWVSVIALLAESRVGDPATIDTLDSHGSLDAGVARAEAIVARYGADAHAVDGGAMLVVVRPGSGDRFARTAACALELCEALPDAAVALATDWTESVGPAPIGEAIDRAFELVRGAGPHDGVLLDAVSAALVGDELDRCVEDGASVIRRKRLGVDAEASSEMGSDHASLDAGRPSSPPAEGSRGES